MLGSELDLICNSPKAFARPGHKTVILPVGFRGTSVLPDSAGEKSLGLRFRISRTPRLQSRGEKGSFCCAPPLFFF